MLRVRVHRLAGFLQERIGMQESDPLLQPCRVYQLGCKLACVHQVEEVAEDIWLYVSGLQTHTVTVLVNEEHSKVVGEGGENGLVGFEEDISDSHSAVAQEAKLPLSVKLLQQDKTMVGQLHSSTCAPFKSAEFAVSPLFVCYRRLVRPLWARSSLYCSLKNAAFVGGGEGSSVGVFRLGVLRYNHMTVGKKTAKKQPL